MTFERCSFHDTTFTDCLFEKCRFENCYMGFGCLYEECVFEGCSITGKHSTLGTKAKYDRCEFNDVRIRSAGMGGVVFERCRFSGTWQSVMLRGPACPLEPTVFRDVDLRGVTMLKVDIGCGVDLSSVELPNQGILVVPNTNGRFTRALRAAAAALHGDARISLEVLGDDDDQDPLVFCDALLADFLEDETGRETFQRTLAESAT